MTMHDKSFLKRFSISLTIAYAVIQIAIKLIDFGGSKEHWDMAYERTTKQYAKNSNYDSAHSANNIVHRSDEHFFTLLFQHIDTLKQGNKRQ